MPADADGQTKSSRARHTSKPRHEKKKVAITSRERVQLDILEDFQSYDEVLFKDNLQKEMLNLGLATQSLKQTEINLL